MAAISRLLSLLSPTARPVAIQKREGLGFREGWVELGQDTIGYLGLEGYREDL